MSRTRKRGGGSATWTGNRMGGWKRWANRKYRRVIKQHLEDEVLPEKNEVANIWDSPGDGKRPVGHLPKTERK